MEGRRVRRFGRIRTHNPTQTAILPVQATRHLSATVSCCYCDYKVSAFNDLLFRLGRKHTRFLRVWFSIGVGFSLTALGAVSMILLWELAGALGVFHVKSEITKFFTGLLFGLSSVVSGLSLSLVDAGYICFSTLVSVFVHEFGHALAAAGSILITGAVGIFLMETSEGIQMEYIAIFIAGLFPGALVAFDCDLLQVLQRFSALRIYCAGIWHNAVCSAVCGLLLFLLPLILFPLFIHGQSPMVLGVPSVSPLSGYLSPGNVIVSLDGVPINDPQDWIEMTTLIDELTRKHSNSSKYTKGSGTFNVNKGYCVPSSMIENGKKFQVVDGQLNQSACSNDFTAFETISCFNQSMSDNVNGEDGNVNQKESMHCLPAWDIVKLKKCDGWLPTTTNKSICACSPDELCSSPIQMPGIAWVEITYSSPYSPECLQVGRESFPSFENSESAERNCGGTFVFVGDVVSMANSVWLTAYQPRWAFTFAAHLPRVLEKILMCTFHVSLTLALLNSLPVYFLDGESILEVTLCYFTLLSSRKRSKVLQLCLLGGTLISILAFLRIFFDF